MSSTAVTCNQRTSSPAESWTHETTTIARPKRKALALTAVLSELRPRRNTSDADGAVPPVSVAGCYASERRRVPPAPSHTLFRIALPTTQVRPLPTPPGFRTSRTLISFSGAERLRCNWWLCRLSERFLLCPTKIDTFDSDRRARVVGDFRTVEQIFGPERVLSNLPFELYPICVGFVAEEFLR